MERKVCFKLLALYLVITTVILTLPSQGWAMFVAPGPAASVKQSDMNMIQRTLESAAIKQRLLDFGLSTEEAMARVNSLSDEQLHQFAANLDSVQAGADGIDALIFILVVVLLVVVILEVSGHRVIVK